METWIVFFPSIELLGKEVRLSQESWKVEDLEGEEDQVLEARFFVVLGKQLSRESLLY